MSGPKDYDYRLTREQQKKLAEQRERELRFNRLKQIGKMFSREKQVSSELLKRSGNDGGFANKLTELEGIISSISPVISSTNYDDVNSLEATSAKVENMLAKSEELVSTISEIVSKNEEKLKEILNADIDNAYYISIDENQVENQTTMVDNKASIENKKEEIKNKLLEVKENKLLSKDLLSETEMALKQIDTIEDIHYLNNYFSITAEPLIKKCKAYFDEIRKYADQYEKLYSEYSALCDLYLYSQQEYPCNEQSIATLKSEIKRIKESVKKDDEQAYIRDCLDEVMEEMGYVVIGSRNVKKKSGKQFRDELYTYGNGTAVNVRYSSDGRIAMELGGVSDVDRQPTQQEVSALCGSMTKFCDDFTEIQKRLLEKGIVSTKITHLPATAEYAQIINKSEYKMTQNVSNFNTKKKHRNALRKNALS